MVRAPAKPAPEVACGGGLAAGVPYFPVPVSPTVRGLLVALELTTVSVLAYAVTAVGVNVTLSLQVLPGATAAEQVPRVTLANGVGALAEVMKSGLAPVLVTSTVFVVLVLSALPPKAMGPAGSENVVAGGTPAPLREIVRGLPAALSVMVIAPERVPKAVGVKVTLIVQFAPAARVAPQVVV